MTNEEPISSTLRTVIPTLIALLAGYGLMQMGNTLQGTLLSVRGGIEGFAAWEIGAIGAGFWLGIVFGSLRAGRLSAGSVIFELSQRSGRLRQRLPCFTSS